MKRVLLTRYPRTRVNPVANIIIKNNLLAVTLILTALPADLKVSRNLVESVGYTIGQYLGAGIERPEVSSCFYQASREVDTNGGERSSVSPQSIVRPPYFPHPCDFFPPLSAPILHQLLRQCCNTLLSIYSLL